MTDHDFLLEEIRLNRAAIEKVGDKVSGKVGRVELFGWLGGVVAVLGFVSRMG